MGTLYIGLISGTSMDGIDAVLASIADGEFKLACALTRPYPESLRHELLAAAAEPATTSLADFGRLHARLAREFADAVADLLARSGHQASEVQAIGSHGQTLLHAPRATPPFSVQAGDPGALAAHTGITVVADFRNADIALAGQGAPLVPAFHRFAFAAPGEDRALVNIGGIANVTLLPARGDVTGFDTGPGNALLDAWYRRHQGAGFDTGGQWAAGGRVQADLLATLLADPYFAAPAPKSTGTDYFCPAWLDRAIASQGEVPAPQDVQASLAELTASTIASALNSAPCQPARLAVCGGGAHNSDLVARLAKHLPATHVASSAAWGIEPDWVEAAAFAWLARERLAGRPGNLPSVTGARAATPLGGVYLPPGGVLR